MPIFSVKTTARQERTVADMLAEKEMPEIQAVIAPDQLTSYVMVEATDGSVFAPESSTRSPRSRRDSGLGGPGGEPFSEVEHFLSPTPTWRGSPRATSSS